VGCFFPLPFACQIRRQFVCHESLVGRCQVAANDLVVIDKQLGEDALVEFTLDLRVLATGQLEIAALGVESWFEEWIGRSTDSTLFRMLVLGPGPGDPRDVGDLRIRVLGDLVRTFMMSDVSFLAVCLSHQILCMHLGFFLSQRSTPSQGVARTVQVKGDWYCLGFYNSFSAIPRERTINSVRGRVEVYVDRAATEVVALRGKRFWSVQFHPESVFSRDGLKFLRTAIDDLVETRSST
jgi:anthranilate/para-aminobenzoate synthase component II